MGMDVLGRNPRDKCGQYFRAAIYHWYPLQAVMIAAGSVEALAWSTNDGHGLESQEDCDKLVNQLEEYLRRNPEVEYVFPVPQELREIETALSAVFHIDKEERCRVHVECVRSFITFLRSCGGFEIR